MKRTQWCVAGIAIFLAFSIFAALARGSGKLDEISPVDVPVFEEIVTSVKVSGEYTPPVMFAKGVKKTRYLIDWSASDKRATELIRFFRSLNLRLPASDIPGVKFSSLPYFKVRFEIKDRLPLEIELTSRYLYCNGCPYAAVEIVDGKQKIPVEFAFFKLLHRMKAPMRSLEE